MAEKHMISPVIAGWQRARVMESYNSNYGQARILRNQLVKVYRIPIAEFDF